MWNHQRLDLILGRPLNDWEIPRLTELYKFLDCLWCKGHSKCQYKVRCGYKILDQVEPVITNCPWKQIWKITLLKQHVSLGSWPMSLSLLMKIWNEGDILCSRCSLCGNNAETVNHLFLHCLITDQQWKITINLRGISWTMSSKIVNIPFSWEEAGVGARSRDRWRIILACIWWTMCRERNVKCFEDRRCNVQ